jgi:hypothetical protein
VGALEPEENGGLWGKQIANHISVIGIIRPIPSHHHHQLHQAAKQPRSLTTLDRGGTPTPNASIKVLKPIHPGRCYS